jgi:hypothetical protein
MSDERTTTMTKADLETREAELIRRANEDESDDALRELAAVQVMLMEATDG